MTTSGHFITHERYVVPDSKIWCPKGGTGTYFPERGGHSCCLPSTVWKAAFSCLTTAARPLFVHCDHDVGPDGFFYLREAVPDSGIVTSLELVLNWTDTLAKAFGDS